MSICGRKKNCNKKPNYNKRVANRQTINFIVLLPSSKIGRSIVFFNTFSSKFFYNKNILLQKLSIKGFCHLVKLIHTAPDHFQNFHILTSNQPTLPAQHKLKNFKWQKVSAFWEQIGNQQESGRHQFKIQLTDRQSESIKKQQRQQHPLSCRNRTL